MPIDDEFDEASEAEIEAQLDDSIDEGSDYVTGQVTVEIHYFFDKPQLYGFGVETTYNVETGEIESFEEDFGTEIPREHQGEIEAAFNAFMNFLTGHLGLDKSEIDFREKARITNGDPAYISVDIDTINACMDAYYQEDHPDGPLLMVEDGKITIDYGA